MYNLKNLIDGAFDESDGEFMEICERYDGVIATRGNTTAMEQELRAHLNRYNEAADCFGGEAHTLDLSGKATQAAITNAINNIVYGSVCTTENGVKYFQTADWPTHDEDIQKTPAPAR